MGPVRTAAAGAAPRNASVLYQEHEPQRNTFFVVETNSSSRACLVKEGTTYLCKAADIWPNGKCVSLRAAGKRIILCRIQFFVLK
jgi:hypothetical protein